ncbi:hypothetical protein FPQ18DRAFT_142982 [Pyronema domesticum]|nr:hypothetical protein FPQ18DRAFT_142982 [Pyronema domesticum]
MFVILLDYFLDGFFVSFLSFFFSFFFLFPYGRSGWEGGISVGGGCFLGMLGMRTCGLEKYAMDLDLWCKSNAKQSASAQKKDASKSNQWVMGGIGFNYFFGVRTFVKLT